MTQTKMRKILWSTLFATSLIGIILMISSTFVENLTYGNRAGFDGKERLILFLYFTFMSNVISLVVSGLVLLNKIKINSIHAKRLKILMLTALTITFLVYWTLLGPKSLPHLKPFKLIATLFIHGITPIAALVAGLYEMLTYKFEEELNEKKVILTNILFPILWFFMCVIVYYSLGAQKEDAIYSFFALEQNPWWMAVVYVFGIAAIFAGLTFMFAKINNKNVNNKVT